jgi:hypothetical protein
VIALRLSIPSLPKAVVSEAVEGLSGIGMLGPDDLHPDGDRLTAITFRLSVPGLFIAVVCEVVERLGSIGVLLPENLLPYGERLPVIILRFLVSRLLEAYRVCSKRTLPSPLRMRPLSSGWSLTSSALPSRSSAFGISLNDYRLKAGRIRND